MSPKNQPYVPGNKGLWTIDSDPLMKPRPMTKAERRELWKILWSLGSLIAMVVLVSALCITYAPQA